jgi:hypothetical protein
MYIMSNSLSSSATPDESKVEAFRGVFEQSLIDIANHTGGVTNTNKERCIILSGGVDTCAIMAAAKKLGVQFGGALTVGKNELIVHQRLYHIHSLILCFIRFVTQLK